MFIFTFLILFILSFYMTNEYSETISTVETGNLSLLNYGHLFYDFKNFSKFNYISTINSTADSQFIQSVVNCQQKSQICCNLQPLSPYLLKTNISILTKVKQYIIQRTSKWKADTQSAAVNKIKERPLQRRLLFYALDSIEKDKLSSDNSKKKEKENSEYLETDLDYNEEEEDEADNARNQMADDLDYEEDESVTTEKLEQELDDDFNVRGRRRERLKRLVQAGYYEPVRLYGDPEMPRSNREVKAADCEVLTTPIPYFRDYDPEEDFDLSAAESNVASYKLLWALTIFVFFVRTYSDYTMDELIQIE